MEIPVRQRFFYFFPVLFCFALPFGSLVLSLIIILWGIASCFNLEKKNLQEGFKNKNLWLLFLFFIVTSLSAMFSQNKAEALFSVENKLSFVFLPYYFYCFKWPSQVLKKCLMAFVSGCFFACVYLITRATNHYFNGEPEYFFYTLFSDFIHASYFAMYLVLAIAIVFLYYPGWFKAQRQYLYISTFFITLFVITIFLCSSKLGIISLFVTAPILFYFKWKELLSFKRVMALVLTLFLLGFLAIQIFPDSLSRLQSITQFSLEDIDKTSSESTAVRVLIWEQCLILIKEHFIFGVTVGDANDALYKAYEREGLTGALSHTLNAHNQYFQTFIGLGVFGFILLLLMTVGQLIKAIYHKKILLLVFSLLIVLNFLVESMLQRADGILFYVFFYCLFNIDIIEDATSQ
jgi:O-antigen ligase